MTVVAPVHVPVDASLSCRLAGRCGGCPWHGQSLAAQRDAKTASILALLGALVEPSTLLHGMTTPSAYRFRQRLDLRLQDGRLGLLGLGDAEGQVVDMERCEVASDEVAQLLTELRADLPPVDKASIRLRARGPLKGVWLDLPNVALKGLLDEGAWLSRRLAAGWVVELGTKGRAVVANPEVRLGEARLMPWSETVVDGQAVDLYTSVMGFTQPGAVPNAALVDAVVRATDEAGDVDTVLELGAGAGNLTLALAGAGHRIVALELEVGALQRTRAEASTTHGATVARVSARAGSFHREAEVPELLAAPVAGMKGVDALVCDPPRSGLGGFIDGTAGKGGGMKGLSPRLRPRHVIYVSCHPEALAKDAARLAALGYRLASLRGIDQFPWTPHAEWIARFSR